MAPKSGALIFRVKDMKKYSSKRWVKKWSIFVKMAPKSGVPFQKVLQKVEHLYKYQGF